MQAWCRDEDADRRIDEETDRRRHGESERRRLHNQVQELKGNIRVFCRMRPLLGEERESGEEVRHVNITSEKNMELTKFAEEANKSIASGTKTSSYDFEFDK